MLHQSLASATDLERWAEVLEGKSTFPEMIRRLILATGAQLTGVSFASAEGTQLGGWDGISTAEQPSAFVPEGVAGWELGTNQDRKGKADDDYEKRTANPLTLVKPEATFVFCIPRRWGGKEQWVNNRRAEQQWCDVRAYDADDLATWLVEAPAVHIWLSLLLHKRILGCTDLESFWRDWAEVITPHVPATLLLAGRSATVDELHGWLLNPSNTFPLIADSRLEAVALLAAAVLTLSEQEREVVLARAVVVTELAVWQELVVSTQSLLLIPLFRSDEAISSAVRQRHHVFIPLDRTDFQAKAHTPVRIDRLIGAQVLRQAGFAASYVDTLAGVARRSMAAFRRHRWLQPLGAAAPVWATAAHAPVLLAAALVGAWNENEWEAVADKETMVALIGLPYEQVQVELTHLANTDQPPVRQVGSTWYVVDKADVWSLMAKFLTPFMLERFNNVVQHILGTPLPQFDLPPEQQQWANLYGKRSPTSSMLRRQVADILAFLGADDDAAPAIKSLVTRSVRTLLNHANAQRTLWLSLANLLPQLAEAHPDIFLESLADGLRGDAPPVMVLFEERPGLLHTTASHPGLLWALELLAWHPSYFGSAARTLARLTQLDPGGNLGNRPANSLVALFLPWFPQTSAPASMRLLVLDGLRRDYPDVAWSLLINLLPNNIRHIGATHNPAWRDWMPAEHQAGISQLNVYNDNQEIIERTITDAGINPDRWTDLIADLLDLTPKFLSAAIQQLRVLTSVEIPDESRDRLVQALRRLIHFQHSLKRKKRKLLPEALKEVKDIYHLLLPQDYIRRYAWLFGSHPHLLSGERYNSTTGYDDYRRTIRQRCRETIDVLLPEVGVVGVLAMLPHVEAPGRLGEALGERSDITDEEKDQLLAYYLGSSDKANWHFAYGLATGYRLTQPAPWEWATAKVQHHRESWAAVQQAAWLDMFTPNPDTWRLAAHLGVEIEQQYWAQLSPYSVQDADIPVAFDKLLQHGRPLAALHLARLHKGVKLPTADLTGAVEAALYSSYPPEPTLGMHGDDMVRLLAKLADAPDAEDERLAKLEFDLLEVQYERRISAKAIYRALCANPAFFVEVLQMFTSSDDRSIPPSSEGDAAWKANKLLHGWSTLPGLTADGVFDATVLIKWVRTAREGAAAVGRTRRGDELIGEMFSASPDGADGLWPHEAVRDALEDAESTALEHGFVVGTKNNRSFTSRSAYEGGLQEWEIAAMFTRTATAVAPQWSRTAKALRQLATSYQRRAQEEDDDANLDHDLGH